MVLCGRSSDRTRADSPRQLPTDHDYAVSTREYQSDQPSQKLLDRLLALSSPNPYSYPDREILQARFQQHVICTVCEYVNICDFGGWGSGEGENLECTPERNMISPPSPAPAM